MSEQTLWCYAREEGDPVGVERVELPPDVEVALTKLYQQPTNLTGMSL